MCIVKVHVSSMSNMKANVMSHSLPMPKIYQALPPLCSELDEVLAFLYIGPNAPTQKKYGRTLMLVRHNKVAKALEWLKMNYGDYADLDISYKKYLENEASVIVNYTHSIATTKDSESTALNDAEEDEGTEQGDCPFKVYCKAYEYNWMRLDKPVYYYIGYVGARIYLMCANVMMALSLSPHPIYTALLI